MLVTTYLDTYSIAYIYLHSSTTPCYPHAIPGVTEGLQAELWRNEMSDGGGWHVNNNL